MFYILQSITLFFLIFIFILDPKPIFARENTMPRLQPLTRNPQPATRNPHPASHIPQPATRNPQSQIRNPQAENLDKIIDGFEKAEKSDEEIPDILKGFEDETEKEVKTEEETETPVNETKTGAVSLDGHLKLGASYNIAHEKAQAGETDWRGLSRLRSELQLELRTKFSESWQSLITAVGYYDFAYTIQGRDEFTDKVLDAYQKDIELEDTYIQGSITDSLDAKLGRQIVVWGKSDNVRVTDVLNPLDLREPGITDIEDLRLPVTMARLDYYFKFWSLTGIVIPEIRFNKNPTFGHDFFPGTQPLPAEDIPEDGFENAEYAATVGGVFSGWDIAFYWADVYNDSAHAQLVSPGPPTRFALKHARIKMLGSAFNIALGNWLLKAEAAWFDGLEFTNTADEEFSRIDLMAGIEYSGFQDATVSIETVLRHIKDFEDILEQPPDEVRENEFQWAIRFTRTYRNDTLTLTALASTFGAKVQDGFFERIAARYALTDAIDISGGGVFYQAGDTEKFSQIGDNDRVYFEIKYSF
jgi:hypothetical protein